MNIQFDVLKKSRELLLRELEGLTLEQIHTTPAGFKNNIAWNVAHLLIIRFSLYFYLIPT